MAFVSFACSKTTVAITSEGSDLVEPSGIEPLTS